MMRVGVWSDKAPVELHEKRRSIEDDRELYEHLISFGRYYFRHPSMDCIGVHLFEFEGLNHLSLTYWNVDCWVRRYCMMVPHPYINQKWFEISIHFEFYGKFTDFCAAAFVFESCATTVSWKKSTANRA